jgi:hypothetical protein
MTPRDRAELSAVPRAGNSREQARTAGQEPQCFRGFSRVFPAVRTFNENRGDRDCGPRTRALWSGVSGFVCGAGRECWER